jgi:hypothetical protein
MHPKKAEILASIETSARTWERMLREQAAMVARPDRYGVAGSLGAAALLPLTALNLLLADFSSVMTAQTEDAVWDRIYPGRSGDTSPRNDAL